MKAVTVKLEEDLIAAAKAEARRQRCSFTHLVRQWLMTLPPAEAAATRISPAAPARHPRKGGRL